MANSEDSLIQELRKEFSKRKPGAFIYKLHGSPMQPGLPDLLVVMERAAALIEAKWATDPDFERPLLDLFMKKLSSGQALNLGQIASLDGPLRARVLIGGAVDSDELPGGTGTLCIAMDVSKFDKLRDFGPVSMLQFAQHILDLRMKRPSTLPIAELVQMQIHASGETWNAVHLLAGIQYCGPINVTKDDDKTFEDA